MTIKSQHRHVKRNTDFSSLWLSGNAEGNDCCYILTQYQIIKNLREKNIQQTGIVVQVYLSDKVQQCFKI